MWGPRARVEPALLEPKETEIRMLDGRDIRFFGAISLTKLTVSAVPRRPRRPGRDRRRQDIRKPSRCHRRRVSGRRVKVPIPFGVGWQNARTLLTLPTPNLVNGSRNRFHLSFSNWRASPLPAPLAPGDRCHSIAVRRESAAGRPPFS